MDIEAVRTTPFPSLIPAEPAPGSAPASSAPHAPSTPEPRRAAVESPPATPDPDPTTDFKNMTLAQLQEACRQRGLPAKGNKATLRKRLNE